MRTGNSFEQMYREFIEEQRRSAVGQRLEMLNRDMTGTRKLLENVLWPVLQSLDGLELEHEMISQSGVKIYIDAFYAPLGAAFECDGYAAHGENLTRERFTFERMRIRSIVVSGCRYYPFSYDEMDKKPEVCRRSVYELLGRHAGLQGSALLKLPVADREIVRLGWSRAGAPFSLTEACACLQSADDKTRRILKRMTEQGFLEPIGKGDRRYHAYRLTPEANKLYL